MLMITSAFFEVGDRQRGYEWYNSAVESELELFFQVHIFDLSDGLPSGE